MAEYLLAKENEEYQIAGTLFREYADWLNIDLGFQKFSEELKDLKRIYNPAHGGIILCKIEKAFIGCIAIRKIDNEIAELKRMYVQPVFQKKGIGAGLLNEAILLAKKCGYKKIRLDTLRNMTNAIDLYKRHGFYEIAAYYFNPENTAVYFEKIIENQ